MLMHVNALILPLGVLFQFANSSPEPRQTCFITRYFKEFFGMRVVERPCPISHDPCSLFRLLPPPVLGERGHRCLRATDQPRPAVRAAGWGAPSRPRHSFTIGVSASTNAADQSSALREFKCPPSTVARPSTFGARNRVCSAVARTSATSVKFRPLDGMPVNTTHRRSSPMRLRKHLANGLCALNLKLRKLLDLVDRNLAFLGLGPNPIPLTIGCRSEDRWFALRT